MQAAIGGTIYTIPRNAGVAPEDAKGVIISHSGPGRYCQNKASRYIYAQQVYFTFQARESIEKPVMS